MFQDDTNTRKRKFPARNGNGSGSGTEVTKTRNFFDLNPEDGKKSKNAEIFAEILLFQNFFFLNFKFTEKKLKKNGNTE